MVYQFAIVLIMTAATSGPVASQSDPYAAFLAEIAEGDGGACRRLNAEHRIEIWDGPSAEEAFASVEAIMADVHGGPEFDDLGCNREFRYEFRACSQIYDPTLAHIVPRGVGAATVEERIALIAVCLQRAADLGLKP